MPMPHAIHAAIRLLLQAREYAIELGRDEWDFAVDIQSLRSAGLTNNDIRWLLYQDYVIQAAEVTRSGDDTRTFRPLGRIELGESSCFKLTMAGDALAHRMDEGRAVAPAQAASPIVAPNGQSPRTLPIWNKDRRILNFGPAVVKQFKVPAPNQEIILATFEEEKWPSRIDDPLPPHPCINSKTRIHDTINSLNRNQKNTLIRFVGDGYGEGVCWEPLKESSSDNGRRMGQLILGSLHEQ